MNLRNKMDEAVDRAINDELTRAFEKFFKTKDAVMLASELRSAEESYAAANKALDKL